MRDALPPTPDGSARTGGHCASCGHLVITAIEDLFYNPPVGSPQRFCCHACRQAAYRRRRAGTPENTKRQHQGGRRRRLNQDQLTTK